MLLDRLESVYQNNWLYTVMPMDPFPVGIKVSTNWSNTWKHACYCAFMYTFTENHMYVSM